MTAPKPRREARLRSALEGLRREATAARPRLHRLLLAGQDTAGARAEADAAAARIAEVIAELAGISAENLHASQKAVAADAARIAAGAMSAIDVRLAALKPPALA